MGRHRIASRKRLVAIASAGVIVGALAAWVTPSFAAGSCATSDIVCHFSYTNSLIQSNGKKLDKLQQSVDRLVPSSTPSPSPSPSTTPTPTPTPSPTPTPTPTSTPPPTSSWPDATNTGVPAGTMLSTYSGSLNINADNTVITGKKITLTDSFRISAKNVVIKDCYIDAGHNYWAVMVDSGNVTIQDSEIVGSDAAAVATDNGSYTLNRVNIHDWHGDGMKLGDDVTVENSWIHDATTQNGQHADGMQLQGGASNVVIRHNRIDPLEDGSDAAVFIKNDLGPNNTVGPVVVDHNLLGGGGFTLYVYKGSSGLAQGGVSVTNNRFLRDGYYGPVATNIPVATWSGNVYDDNAATISP